MSKNNSFYGRVNILRILSSGEGRVHFVGVCGAGMSSLFLLSAYFGIRVSGEDKEAGENIDALGKMGDITIGTSYKIDKDISLIVYTLAVSDNHNTLVEAERLGIPIVSRAEYMSALVEPFIKKIAISGTHGKSTTTAMLNLIFKDAGYIPTTLCGAPLDEQGRGIEIGALEYLIYEACEYKNSFLYFEPTIALFLNLEYDHPDFFKSYDELSGSFFSAMKKAKVSVVNYDDVKLREIAEKLDTPPIFFGKSRELEYSYEIISSTMPSANFYHKGNLLGIITLSVLGEFNIQNALGAAAVAHRAGIPFDVIAGALQKFSGIPRRLEMIGSWCGRCVYYDYAHHPTEIRAGIKALKAHTGRPVTVVFTSHTYSRTKALWQDFVSALSLADYKIIGEISGIREEKIKGVSGEALAIAVGGEFCKGAKFLLPQLYRTEGDIVIMGAADMKWAKNILKL